MAITVSTAIKRLKKLADDWPDGISLFSASGSLLVIKDNDRLILDDILIPSDGGDPNIEIRNGKEYLIE